MLGNSDACGAVRSLHPTFIVPIRICLPNGISVSSSVFAGFTDMCVQQTARHPAANATSVTRSRRFTADVYRNQEAEVKLVSVGNNHRLFETEGCKLVTSFRWEDLKFGTKCDRGEGVNFTELRDVIYGVPLVLFTET